MLRYLDLSQFHASIRVLMVLSLAITVIQLTHLTLLGGVMLCCFLLLFTQHISFLATIKKLLMMDGMILFMLITFPFTMKGETLFSFWGLTASKEGMFFAFGILFKSNAILGFLFALCYDLSPIVFGHALQQLRVPDKFVHLMLFTIRYIAVIKHEYRRMRQAMRARAFILKTNFHVYRSIGYLLGMLLVRAHIRGQHVANAMRCRGFNGKFYLIHARFLKADDFLPLAIFSVLMIGLLMMDDAL